MLYTYVFDYQFGIAHFYCDITDSAQAQREFVRHASDCFGISRDQLGEEAGYKRSTRDAYIQHLGRSRIINVNGPQVSASHDLF